MEVWVLHVLDQQSKAINDLDPFTIDLLVFHYGAELLLARMGGTKPEAQITLTNFM